MPSHIGYTPFETLKLCQSIVHYGDDLDAFQIIANELNASTIIRESGSYDAERLTADALHILYTGLIQQESSALANVNGDGSADTASTKKRKASSSPKPDDDERDALVQSLVDKLYARFREETTKEINREEEEYLRLEKEIQELEAQQQAATLPQPTPAQPTHQPQNNIPDGTPPVAQAQQSVPAAPSPAPGPARPPSAQDVAMQNNGMSPHPQQPAHGPQHSRNVPSPAPGRPHMPQHPMPPQQGYPHGPPGHPMMPYPPPMQQMPPPMDYAGRKGSSATSTPARGSPVPQSPQQYPPYQHYQPPPQWPQQYPQQQHPYPPPHMQYPNQGYYPQPVAGRPPPQYPQSYSPYPPNAPGPYQHPPHGWHPSPSNSPHPYPQSAFSTPSQHPPQRPPSRTPGSSTPWKRRQLPPNTLRPPSPTRPDRGVSPFSDTEAEEVHHTRSAKSAQKAATPKRGGTPARRGRPPSVAASGRSQSVASQRSATPQADSTRKATTVKVEAPSTPLPDTSETEQRSSGRRGHLRNTPSASASRSDVARAANNKRKRSSPVPEIATPPPSDAPAKLENQSTLYPADSSLVLVSKNFAKTSQLVLNEITSHKLGGVFAKPLTERDAPGYKDLVLRPQDLKSIKTAVSKGSRAAIAAIEALGLTEDENDETQEHIRDEAGQGPVGNGFYLVKKSDDLEPPKGIVNAAQLEMELMRIFANAIMFNPLPRTERGFGYNLRLRKRGGDVLSRERDDTAEQATADDATEEGDEEEAETSPTTSESDAVSDDGDTGIIADAREMFDDVRRQVQAWRELEKERQQQQQSHHSTRGDDGGESSVKGGGGGRQDSVLSGAADDAGGVGANTPIASKEVPPEEGRGTLRKRRKLTAAAAAAE